MSKKPTPDELMAAIHRHCLACSGGSRKEVQNCRVKECNLYLYRQAQVRTHEKPPKGQMTIFDVVKKESE